MLDGTGPKWLNDLTIKLCCSMLKISLFDTTINKWYNMRLMHYYNLVVFLFSASVMATNTCINQYGLDVDNPGASCADIYDTNPASHGKSGYYVVKTDHVLIVYCDMELGCSVTTSRQQ